MGSLRATNQAASQNALHSLTDATVHVLDGDASAQSAIAAALAPLRVVVESFLDRKLFRTAAEQLAAQPGCAIVDCGASSDEVMALLESLTSSPDELVRPTIVVSAHASVAMAVAAMQRRAWTVLEKPLSLWGLRQTVAEACQWSLQRREKLDKLNDQARCWQTLTSEEQVIIELAMQGAPNKAISSQLGLSLRTIESRRQGILRHFGVRTLTELACLLARYRSRESSRRALPGHPAWLVDAAHRPRPQG